MPTPGARDATRISRAPVPGRPLLRPNCVGWDDFDMSRQSRAEMWSFRDCNCFPSAAPCLDPYFRGETMRTFPSTLSANAFHAYREERRPLWMLLSGPCAFGVLGCVFPAACAPPSAAVAPRPPALGPMRFQGELLPSQDGLNGQPAQHCGCHRPQCGHGTRGLGENKVLVWLCRVAPLAPTSVNQLSLFP